MASYSKRQTAKGTVYDVRFMADCGGVRKLVHLSGYSSRKAAETAYITWQAPQTDARQIPEFEKAVNFYVESKKGCAAQNTAYNLGKVFDKHITPYFSGRSVASIVKADIVAWQSRLWAETTATGAYLANGTCKQVRADFAAFMAWASVLYGFDNPFTGVKAPYRREMKKAPALWSVADFERFAAVCGSEFRPFFQILFYSGARVGEILALTAADFHRTEGGAYIISITKSAQAERKNFDITTPTKNSSSERQVELPAALTESIAQLLADSDGLYLFGGCRPWGRGKVAAAFNAGIELAGVSKIRVHDLRHSHASILLSLGVPVAAVSRRLGHKNITTTLNTYAHCLAESESALISCLNSYVSQSTGAVSGW